MSVLMTPEKIVDVFGKIENCGNELIEITGLVNSQIIIKEIVKYCNNRVCNKEPCMVHREYLYKRNHGEQIKMLDKSIDAPKAWVFTGWVFPYPIDRDFCREKLRELFALLNNRKIGSVTEFSIHMEVKLREKDWYLHFHVVSGGLGDFHFVRYLWGRVVSYEYAIKKDRLASYVSKYTSKTPLFKDDVERIEYLRFIYKTQTSRFSCGKSGYVKSGWYLIEALEYEAYVITKRANEANDGKSMWSTFPDEYEKRRSTQLKRDVRFIEDWVVKDFFVADTFENFMKKVREYSWLK